MKTRETLLIVLALLLAGGLLLVFRKTSPEPARQPTTLAGHAFPLEKIALDPNVRYDVSAYVRTGRPIVYRSVRILGVAGAAAGGRHDIQGDWIVLELPDMRKVYLPPDQIDALEQSPQETKP